MDEPLPLDLDETWTIAQLYEELISYLDRRWGRTNQLWLTGEIQHLTDHRTGNGYLDLVDPDRPGRDAPVVRAKCWRTNWSSIKGSLRRHGIALEEGAVVRVRGYVDVYAPRGELSFIVTALDVEALRRAALGEHARRRQDLLVALGAEGLLERNRSLPFPELPLVVGLVASKDTEGCNDFLGTLEASGFAFEVVLAPAAVQGPRAPRELTSGVLDLARGAVDVICIVRGGGAQSDLHAFDDERVARAIATCGVPVLTGVGHTGDISVADLVAHAAHRTPTACGEALVSRVRDWYGGHVADPARALESVATGVVDELTDVLHQRRRHLAVVGRHHLERARDRLAHTSGGVVRGAPRALDAACARRVERTARLVDRADSGLRRASAALQQRRTLLAAYDPGRQLARGWTITTDAAGRLVRAADLEAGSAIVTRFADGVARSTVTGVDRAGSEGS